MRAVSAILVCILCLGCASEDSPQLREITISVAHSIDLSLTGDPDLDRMARPAESCHACETFDFAPPGGGRTIRTDVERDAIARLVPSDIEQLIVLEFPLLERPGVSHWHVVAKPGRGALDRLEGGLAKIPTQLVLVRVNGTPTDLYFTSEWPRGVRLAAFRTRSEAEGFLEQLGVSPTVMRADPSELERVREEIRRSNEAPTP